MPTSALQAQIDAATAYEEFFVPALFQEWAPRVVAAAQLQPGQRVLDVACGTGVLAREAAARVGAAGTIVGAPSEARLCQLGAEPSLGSPGEAPSTKCCVGEGNDVDEAYTGR
jgi:hypothetical protein